MQIMAIYFNFTSDVVVNCKKKICESCDPDFSHIIPEDFQSLISVINPIMVRCLRAGM